MRQVSAKSITLAAGLATALTLAACSSSSNSAGTTTSPSTTAPTSSSPPASTSSSTPLPDASGNCAGTAPKPAAATGGTTLKIGTLLPQTGSLAFLGPPEIAGVKSAIKDINAAGGVLGHSVTETDADSGDTSTNIASTSVDRLESNKVSAIIGAASSSVTLSVIDKITGAGTIQVSPANTSITLSCYPDHGLYWRTAPPDLFQGRVLGQLAASDGHETLGILALQDAYGTGLATQAQKSFEAAGGKVVYKTIYDPKAADYNSEVNALAATKPSAIALIGFDESKKIIPELVKAGIGPSKVQLYLVDGNLADYSKDFPKGTLMGTKGTTPGVAATKAFQAKLLAVNPKLGTQFSYGPESYDATVLVALAAIEAGDTSGASIAAHMQDVSEGGTTCVTFAACAALLKNKTDINYNGLSGPVDFDAFGNPTSATMGIYEYKDASNNYTSINYVSGKVSG